MKNGTLLTRVLILASALAACGSEGDEASAPLELTASSSADARAAKASSSDSLCAKYGGAVAIAGAIKNHVLPKIGADCRINPLFAQLSEASGTRILDCLSIHAQELFGCPGIVYAGSRASNGLACRNMTDAHAGQNLSGGDFEALLDDIVEGFVEFGVERQDVMKVAPVLLGMKREIVEVSDESPSAAMCAGERE